MNCLELWPCEYCKKKFIDVVTVINHELYVCDKNPKFQYRSKKLELNSKVTKCINKYNQTSSDSLKT